MADKKSFLLRVDKETLDRLQGWADDELRSLNGQIEYLLRDALRKAGRLKTPPLQAPRPDKAMPPESVDTMDVNLPPNKENE